MNATIEKQDFEKEIKNFNTISIKLFCEIFNNLKTVKEQKKFISKF